VAVAPGLEGFELVEVLDELAAEVGFVAGEVGEMALFEDEAFASDASDCASRSRRSASRRDSSNASRRRTRAVW
jgi:hypothetical protein